MKVSEPFRLEGKTAIVTGSAQGLGKEIPVSLAQNGASLVLVDIAYPEETAEKT